MPSVTKEALRQLLSRSIRRALEDAQQHVADPLPRQLYVECANLGQRGQGVSLEEVMAFLYRDGTFPRIVDIAIRGIKNGRTYIWIRASGHPYVSDFAATWNTPPSMGPFKSLSLMLPNTIWQRRRPFSRHDLEEAGEKQ
jgi:hypothetical protein